MKDEWQIANGLKCGCGGADEYCGCQNDPDHFNPAKENQISRLRRIIHRYGDRVGMATCPRPDWQREIDDAMEWVANNPEKDISAFPSESP